MNKPVLNIFYKENGICHKIFAEINLTFIVQRVFIFLKAWSHIEDIGTSLFSLYLLLHILRGGKNEIDYKKVPGWVKSNKNG